MDDPGNPKTLEAMPADQSMREKFKATQDDCPSMPETSVVIPSNLSSETSKESSPHKGLLILLTVRWVAKIQSWIQINKKALIGYLGR